MGIDKWRLAALLGLSAVWLVLVCVPVMAHATLIETYPANGNTLAESPEQVQLRFDEPVEAEFDPIEVYDRQGNRVDRGNARVYPDDARVVVVDLEELPEGSYTVDWRVTSADGHPVSGTYGFAVDASAAGTEGVGNPIVQVDPIEQPAEQQQTGSARGIIRTLVLGLLLVGALVVAGFVVLRRR
ncbi:MAG TPA: copper resistance protein CopC [Actinomycetota bacterium]|nr:copper resistance protein CopC [Actinomycetota bacterium]